MKEQLVSFETAKLSKDKSFNEKCGYFYKRTGESEHCHFWFWKHFVNNDYIEDIINNSSIAPLDEECTAPPQSLLQKWLREKHNIVVSVIPHHEQPLAYTWMILTVKGKSFGYENGLFTRYPTYEDALEIGLQQALNLMKKFELIQSPKVPHMWQLFNHKTGEAAKLTLKSLRHIKHKYALFINSETHFYFEFMPKYEAQELIELIPNHRL